MLQAEMDRRMREQERGIIGPSAAYPIQMGAGNASGTWAIYRDPISSINEKRDDYLGLVPSPARDKIKAADEACAAIIELAKDLTKMMKASPDTTEFGFTLSIKDSKVMSSVALRRYAHIPGVKEGLDASRDVILGCAINATIEAIAGLINTVEDSGFFVAEDWVKNMVQAHREGRLSPEMMPNEFSFAMRAANPSY
jgi:hypothetical protein